MKKIKLLVLLLLAALFLVCIGCSGQQKEVTGENQEEVTGKDAEPIKIGFLADKTGALASYGYAHELVGKAAVKHINETGGINGRPVELIIRDTESTADVAAVEARRLVESNEVDFLLGSNTSANVLAIAPVAKELKTVYFATAGGALLTEPGKGNRYVFDFNTDVKQETMGVVNFIKEDLKINNWVTAVVDYSWGWDQEVSFTQAAENAGLNVLANIKVPLATDNWLRYLQGNIPDEAEGIYFANFGTDFISFIRDINSIRPDLAKIGGNYVLAGQNISDFGETAEGIYVIVGYPTWAYDDESDSAYRKAIGMDDFGCEAATGTPLVSSYQWSTWETIHAIRDIIEASGWESKADTPKFIETLEKYEFTKSLSYPEGDKKFRPVDHLTIKGAWIEQIQNGELTIVKRIQPENMIYDPMINLPEDEPF